MRRRAVRCLCVNGQLLTRLSLGATWRGVVSCPTTALRAAESLAGRALGNCPAACTVACALLHATRGQSTNAAVATSDKKFHCSVCFKAFRLAMAAKVHLQQAHNGEGSILDGAGPGQPQQQQHATPPASQAAQSEKSRDGLAERQSVAKDEPRFVPRHLRSIPKPLHEPDRELPAAVMEQLLDTWDAVGLKRLGGKFVHSSMVMKVFAGKPNATDTAGSPPMTTAHGATALHAATTATPTSSPSAELPHAASDATAGAFPFGMMPTFGQTPTSPSTPAAASAAMSPFAAAVASPFTNPVASPFAAATATATAVSSPFVNSAVATMNATATAAPSPFLPAGTAAPSPFTNMPFAAATAAASSFTDAAMPSLTTATAGTGEGEMTGEDTTPSYDCPVCGRSFASHAAMRAHSKDKHHVEQPAEKRTTRRQRTAAATETLEIPAYVPSPVDLTATTPFGTRAQEPSWTETEITPHAGAMSSSMTVLGTVLDVQSAGPHASTVTVYVVDEAAHEEDEAGGQMASAKDSATRQPPAHRTRRTRGEMITLRCTGVCNDTVCATLRRHDLVFACGALRMPVVQDADSALGHAVPLVEVCMPMGMIAKVSE